MDSKKLRQVADAAEARAARLFAAPRPITEAELAAVLELRAVDDYVAATGEYPLSRDVAGPDVVDEGLSTDAGVAGLGANIRALPGYRRDDRA